MSLDDDLRIVVASRNSRRSKSLCRKLSEGLPQAKIIPTPDMEAAEKQLKEARTHCLVVDEGCGDDGVPVDLLIGRLRRKHLALRLLWILSKPVDTALWLKRAQAHDVVILLHPVSALELSQHCRPMVPSARPKGTRETKRLTDLLRRRSESLHESDERYRLLFNTNADGVALLHWNPEREFLDFADVNYRFCQMVGYPREELIALRPRDLVEPYRIAFVNSRLDSILVARQIHFETVFVSRDGRYVPVAVTARLFSIQKRPCIIAIIHASRERAMGTAAVANQRKPFESGLQTGHFMYEFDVSKEQLRLSGAVRQVTGRDATELTAAALPTLLHIIHEDDRREALAEFTHAATELSAYRLRYRIVHASGEIRHLEDSGIVLPDESGKAGIFLGSIIDSSQPVRSEIELRATEQQLQHSKRLESLGVLAGGIAHDFNNILSAIIGLTDLSIQALEGSDPEVLEDLAESLGAAHRAKDLVRQILAFSRQSSEEHKPLYLHTVVREVLGLLRASLPASIEIVERLDTRSGMVLANATQMHQVVMNYCTNGLHAMSEKGGVLHVQVENTTVTRRFADIHSKLKEGPYVKLSVSDRGHGMARSVVQRIFDPFYTTKGPGEGAGMGLAMAHGIIANHGGTILVESAVGKGTQIHTYLPRVESVSPDETALPVPAKRGTERILIVDDERTVLRFCERALKQLGYDVQLSSSPEEALERVKSDLYAFDIVITDYHMPGMTGVGLARRIHRLRNDMPMLLFTGFSLDVDESEAARAGINEILNKPVVVSELTEALRRVLDEQTPSPDENAGIIP